MLSKTPDIHKIVSILYLTGKKLDLKFIVHAYVVGHCPPYVHLTFTSHDK